MSTTTNDFTRFQGVFAGDILDRVGSSTNDRLDRIQEGISGFLPPDARDRVNDNIDSAQVKLSDALERAKYRISGSLPSGSGFN